MGISVQNNADGSVTVRCGADTVTVYLRVSGDPGEPGAISELIPVITSDDDDPPLTGWPLPGAFHLSYYRFPKATHVRLPGLNWQLAYDQDALSRFLLRRSGFGAHEPLMLGIHTQVGVPVDISELKLKLKALGISGGTVLPYLIPDVDGDGD